MRYHLQIPYIAFWKIRPRVRSTEYKCHLADLKVSTPGAVPSGQGYSNSVHPPPVSVISFIKVDAAFLYKQTSVNRSSHSHYRLHIAISCLKTRSHSPAMATDAAAQPAVPTTISLRAPSQYVSEPPAGFTSPSLEWLTRTWSVTHSTLAMWRDAQNVRITYKPIPTEPGSPAKIDDLVEYEKKGGSGGLKTVAGVDTADAGAVAAWDWRGKGWLMIASSHWEVLGWGERPCADGEGGVERWAVTWFAATLFTKEGLDIYSDRKEGPSKETVDGIMTAFNDLEESAPRVTGLVKESMEVVHISLPWKEK
ncbi:hypothetical protein MN608_01423 [Microdochium nivale]|nr:hypothetical protein MN608_01423 [Microdochium nivale]